MCVASIIILKTTLLLQKPVLFNLYTTKLPQLVRILSLSVFKSANTVPPNYVFRAPAINIQYLSSSHRLRFTTGNDITLKTSHHTECLGLHLFFDNVNNSSNVTQMVRILHLVLMEFTQLANLLRMVLSPWSASVLTLQVSLYASYWIALICIFWNLSELDCVGLDI